MPCACSSARNARCGEAAGVRSSSCVWAWATRVTAPIAWPVHAVTLWNGKRAPFLYRAEVEVWDTGGERSVLADNVSQTFGLRTFRVDPRTGLPADALVSVTVVGPSLMWADVYATAACAYGDDAMAWLETLEEYEALIVYAGTGLVQRTKGWRSAV